MIKIKLGNVFWDSREGRLLTVDGQGIDPQVFSCTEEDLNENGDFEVTSKILMKENELLKMERIAH